jgi:hypothetical protein
MASSAAKTVPYTDAVLVSHTAPTLVYTVKEGAMANLPCTIAVANPSSSANSVFICNSDDVDTSRGYEIVVGGSVSIDLPAGAKLFMIAAVADVTIRYVRSGSQ